MNRPCTFLPHCPARDWLLWLCTPKLDAYTVYELNKIYSVWTGAQQQPLGASIRGQPIET